MKKILYVASVVKLHINVFHLPYLNMLKNEGYETHVAAKNDTDEDPCIIPYCDCYHEINFDRSPFSIKNIKAYRQLKKLFAENSYDIIHCHTPVASILTRIAARTARKKGTKVIYTAHGFHFFKGAPIKNWLIYYPIERLCARFTDVLITINKEDFKRAIKFKAKKAISIPGVGLNLSKFKDASIDTKVLRESLGISEKAFVLLSVGELSKRKNHQIILKALHTIKDLNFFYLIVGQGPLKEKLTDQITQYGLENKVKLTGFCSNVHELYWISDLFVFPSLHEGLPVALMEAMAAGLPSVCSRVRGNTELIEEEKGGYLCDPQSAKDYARSILTLIKDSNSRSLMGTYNQHKIDNYSVDYILDQMKEVYFGK